MGDPAGISPEIIVASLEEIKQSCSACIFGHRATMLSLVDAERRQWIDWRDAPAVPEDGRIVFVDSGPNGPPIQSTGPACAEAQLNALAAATDAMLAGRFSALVTAPVAKNAISTLRPDFSGHTEYLAERAGLESDDVTMLFAADKLSVALVTTHIPLRDVPDAITEKRLKRTFRHLTDMLHRLHPGTRPRIAVASLNPHAGENGLFGAEEWELLEPFCEAASSGGDSEVFGPVPSDALFRDAFAGRYDGVVALYHDQALIPLKMAGVGQAVNVTMGLPFLRTSPDHGTAYDIARKGLADPEGFRAALRLAVRMTGSE